MNWESKLAKLRGLEGEREELAIIFGSAPSASAEALDAIRRDVAGVPAEYIDFLRQTDGLQIDMNVLAGSGGSGFPSLKRLRCQTMRTRDRYDRRAGRSCVVGEEALERAHRIPQVNRAGRFASRLRDATHHDEEVSDDSAETLTSKCEFLGERGPPWDRDTRDLFPNDGLRGERVVAPCSEPGGLGRRRITWRSMPGSSRRALRRARPERDPARRQRAPWDGGRPRAAPAGGAEEPDALRGARRAGPQFPRPSRASHPCRGA